MIATIAFGAQVVDPTREIGDRVLWVAERPGENELKGEEFVAQAAFGGTYQEFDIPSWDPSDTIGAATKAFDLADQPAGTWTVAP